jgi:hypothetical protein
VTPNSAPGTTFKHSNPSYRDYHRLEKVLSRPCPLTYAVSPQGPARYTLRREHGNRQPGGSYPTKKVAWNFIAELI